MAFVLAWLDASEHERRRALDVIDLFDQPETVDELGVGTVRDAVAEVLSPGTSTIQTRARYFFFIPWGYQKLEGKAFARGAATTAARRIEVSLIEALAKAPDTSGVIGIASGASLQRLPSEAYWAGLTRLGFKLFQGSRAQYHRVLDRGIREVARDDAGDLTIEGAFRGNWHPHIPPPPEAFPEGATLDLTRAEAEFFAEQLKLHARGSLLEFLVSRGEPVGEIWLPWEHPEVAAMGPDLRRWLEDGRCYSELLSGAQLLYNLMLAEKKDMKEHVAAYGARLEEWVRAMQSRRSILAAWDRSSFWERLRKVNQRLPHGVWRFSEAWITRTLDGNATDPAADRRVRDLISGRERELKGRRARLFSQAHLDLWRGASSPEPLNYRWWVTRRIVDDIVAGLKRPMPS